MYFRQRERKLKEGEIVQVTEARKNVQTQQKAVSEGQWSLKILHLFLRGWYVIIQGECDTSVSPHLALTATQKSFRKVWTSEPE